MLGLLFSTLTTNGMYLVLNRDRITLPIQMQLPEKQKKFSQFFAAILKSIWNYERIGKNMTLIAFVFPKLRTPKRWLDKCLKSPVSEDLSTSNMVNVPKHFPNLDYITCIIFIDHYEINLLGKSLSYRHGKSWDCFLQHWLPMECILF